MWPTGQYPGIMGSGRVREAATDPATAEAVTEQDAACLALSRGIVPRSQSNVAPVTDTPETMLPRTGSVASEETQWPKTASPRGGTT
jgi:hypothetical protein